MIDAARLRSLTEFEPNIGAPTDEPCLRTILRCYYARSFSIQEAVVLADKYIAALIDKEAEGFRSSNVPIEETR